jgi:aquaporin Z
VSEIAQSGSIAAGQTLRQPRSFLRREASKALYSLRYHWPEYLMETGELACYMFFACAFATLLQHPASPVRHFVIDGFFRRMLYGVVMGAIAIAIVMSPWGKQSGAHCNPGVTFTFYRLGKVDFWDAFFYAAGQFSGAIGGVAIARYALRGAAANDAVRYAITAPGKYGVSAAFLAELVISFALMLTILVVTNQERLARYTPYFAGALIAAFLTFESPLSGMSMNPARTLGSAFHASYWYALWIYFTAPPLGMLAAAELFLVARGGKPPICAKLHHANNKRCIFHCGYRTMRTNDT